MGTIFQVQLACAGVVKLADTPDLGSGAARRGGSSPSTRTIYYLFFAALSAIYSA